MRVWTQARRSSCFIIPNLRRRTRITLDIGPNEQVKEGEGKVVGTCDGSTQKIVYKRGVADAPPDMAKETKSQPK